MSFQAIYSHMKYWLLTYGKETDQTHEIKHNPESLAELTYSLLNQTDIFLKPFFIWINIFKANVDTK